MGQSSTAEPMTVPRHLATTGDTIETALRGGNVFHLADVIEARSRSAHHWVRTDCGREGVACYVAGTVRRCRNCYPR